MPYNPEGYTLDCSVATRRGTARDRNEDDFLGMPLRTPAGTASVFAVAGGEASSLALSAFFRHLLDPAAWAGRSACLAEDVLGLLRDAVARADRRLRSEGAACPDKAGLGTTLTAILVLWPRWHLAHVGD